MPNNDLRPEDVALETLLDSASTRLRNILASMDGKETDNVFRPVRCVEKDIENRPSVNGFIYFTTDTKKIYCGVADGEYQMMGGSSGVYYGSRQLTDDEKYGDQVFFSFTPEEIDGSALPAIDDLILNIPDGGFYRVLQVSNTDIQTQRLVIAGGGGSGGGGGGGITNEGSLIVNFVTPQYSSTLTGVEYYIDFDIIAKDSAGDMIMDEGLATWKINGKQYSQKVYNGRNSFRVDEYLDHTIEQNKIILVVNMTTGGSSNTIVSKTWYVTAINLSLDWPWIYSEEEYRSGETFTLRFTPYGNIDCDAHIIFDGNYDAGSYYIENIPASKTGKSYTTNPMPALSYGSHSCEIYLEALVNGETKKTVPIKHEITFTRGGNSTILTVPYYSATVTQYDTINIPFLVYDPDSEKCNVSFYVNDKRVSGDSYDRSLHYWPYTVTDFGSLKLTIKSDNEDDYKDIELVVNKLDLDVSEASGAAFSLKATNFSSNEEIRNWNSNGVRLTFSENFDWKNGGLQFETKADGSVEKYISVRQGTRMYINYKLFEKFTTGSSGGKNFKFCFRAANCYDYSAEVLKCYDSHSKLGIRFDAQKATFETPANQGFKTQYYENTYLEVETEIWPNVPDTPIPNTDATLPGDRFIMIWVDGIPAGVKAYNTNETLTQTQPQIIEIGSDLCDVYVYVAKAYERSLSEDEHLNNFIMDAPSANKMMDRYRRNAILDNRGDISYEKLVAANPECRAYLYDVPKMTTSKDDKVKGCVYNELWRENNTLDNPYLHAEDVQTYVQGTSSAAYGVAAFNLRSKFKTLTDKDGNELSGWQVTEEALPIEIACTKVNVASCENVNNVVNQEWYHRFQPYHDAHRRKNPKARDTMQFESGVIFIKDNNKETNYYDNDGKPNRDGYLNANTFLDTKDYTTAPYYKQYAIGNMGNDKKNVNVFHDTENYWALCVEVADNQNPEHWMTVPINMSQFDLEKPFHEFRYPDGNDKAKDDQKQAWIDFVDWMCASNPKGGNANNILKATAANVTADTYKKNVYFIQNADGAYVKAVDNYDSSKTYYTIAGAAQQEGDELINVLFDAYTFKGFDPPGYEGATNPSGISLKGVKETLYSTTKVITQQKTDADGNPVLDDNGEFVMEEVYSTVPYTHDTFEYRMAKMLSECEDHLVMDSVMYHYLFIQRHTMVDNVAKNTFWSTEDGIHWDLTKDYDNDTSDGNNNSGYLTFTYGLECFDTLEDGSDIFNASPSVWFNFVHGLPAAQKSLHKDLEGAGAWDAKTYLEECKRHQDKIPERCWIYDYIRKYIRPRRLGLDSNTYLERLEGGKKTHQRAQYETYQEFYLNSKYVAGSAFSQGTAADLRLNKDPSGVWDPTNILPMSFYIDCYSTVYLGGQLKTSPRLKRGQIWNAPVGEMIGAPNDATCYIFGPNMLQTISGLHKLYPFYATMNTASKLREIAFGSKEAGYYNAKLKAPDIGSNAMLQKVQLWNSGITTGLGDLDLSKAYQLKEVLLSGSTTTTLTLAQGSTVHTLELNPLTTLTLTDLSYITNLTMDEGIHDSITNMYIVNSPALDPYTYRWAKQPQIDRYQLNDFHWTIANREGYDPAEDFTLDNNGKVTGIKALDNLNDTNSKPKDGLTTATALTGKLTIDAPCTVDEYNIYKKYAKTYPNLIIEYGNNVGSGLNRAVELIFMKSEGALEQHYRVLGSGEAEGETIAHLISANGPTGLAMQIPSREPTAQHIYTFTGYWIDQDGKKYYNADDLNGKTPEAGATSFTVAIPTKNLTFYPEYITAPRTYPVKFYDWEGKIIPQEKVTITTVIDPTTGEQSQRETIEMVNEWPVAYGTKYDGPMRNYHYRDSNDLRDVERWAFQGWSQNKYGDKEVKDPEYVDVTDMIVTNTVLLYGHYLKEDCTKVASRAEYFVSTNNNTEIMLSEDYYGKLSGKITIPSKAPDGTYYTRISNMKHLVYGGVTHIYFLNDSRIETVCDSCFSNTGDVPASTVREIHLPNTVKHIDNDAFSSLASLQVLNIPDSVTTLGSTLFQNYRGTGMQVEINELPSALTSLGMGAFAGAGPNVKISKLPKGLAIIPTYAFNGVPNVKISQIGGSDGSGVTQIGTGAFENAGGGSWGDPLTRIEVHMSVTAIYAQAFLNYGKIETAAFARYDASNDGVYGATYSEMGLVGVSIEALA